MTALAGEVNYRPIREGEYTGWSFGWITDAAGSARYRIDDSPPGWLWKLFTRPYSVAVAYGVTLVDERGYDWLHGAGASRSATIAQSAFLVETAAAKSAGLERPAGSLIFTIASEAAKRGLAILWWTTDASAILETT